MLGKPLPYAYQSRIIAAYYFLLCGAAHGFVVHNAVARHINANIGGAFIRRFAQNSLKHSVKHGKYLNIPVIIYGCFAVCFKVERIYHINIVKICGCRLVRYINGVLKRNIPNRERFKFGIARFNTALMLVVKLR